MIEWCNNHTVWHKHARILLLWQPNTMPFSVYQLWADLILVPAEHDAHLLCVSKMRDLSLSSYETALQDIFQEYEIEHDGVIHHVRLSDAELIRWQLLCAS